MNSIEKDNLSIKEKVSLLQLWNDEYPARLNYKNTEDFDLYLSGLTNTKHYLLFDDSDEIMGWAYTFIRDNENWFAILLNHQIQGKGIGSHLINELKKNNTSLNGWVTDLETEIKQNQKYYRSPMEFYIKNGFKILTEIRIENDRISGVKINWTDGEK
ncbi:MAG: GNAT family N-acetyltransferase [Flavobacterium sp.]